MTALYTHDGASYVPGPLTVGPWSPDAQHGGPVSALLAGALEDAAGELQVVRVTVELLRPVPVRPLSLSSELVRPGRNVRLVEATLSAAGTEFARARGLAIRRLGLDLPVDRSGPPAPLPEDDGADIPNLSVRTAFAGAMNIRFVKGGWDELGPVTMWTRLTVPVVEGREASPLQRATAAADFGNGVSRILDFETHVFINPDLTVALARVPESEWLLFDSVSRLSPDGFGQSESQIFDTVGPVGRSVQSLLVSER